FEALQPPLRYPLCTQRNAAWRDMARGCPAPGCGDRCGRPDCCTIL
ncbi:hypothetical protein BN1723_019194, partial [Verticillium longisporum]